MLNDSEVRALALFFFFACLDETRAKEAASKAADEFERMRRKDANLDSTIGVVSASSNIWDEYRARISRGRPRYSADSGWILPENVDMGHWKEFQKSAPEDELVSVIWVHILGYSEEVVARALGLTEGTLRYRVGRGLRKLGGLLARQGRPLKAVKNE